MRARPNPLATAAPLPHEEPKTSYLPSIGLPSSRPVAPFRGGGGGSVVGGGADPFRGGPDSFRGGDGGFRGLEGPYRGGGGGGVGPGGPKDGPQPQLIISGVNAEVSLADFHHFLSRWGQVVDSSVTMQGYGTATFATWAGTDAILQASPLRFKGMELVVRPPARGGSPLPFRRRPYEDIPFNAREQAYNDLPPYPGSAAPVRGGEFVEPVGIRETDRPRVARMTPGPRPSGPRPPRENRDTGLNTHGEPKLYIGGVTSSTAEELKAFMEQFGEVADTVVMAKGFGFCTFKDAAGTAAALAGTNLEFDGQTLTIEKARPKGERPEDSSDAKVGGQPKLYVAGVGKETPNADFRAAMSVCGEVFDCIVMPSGFGFCTFKDSEGTDMALRTKIKIGEKKLTCQRANPKSGDRGGGGRDRGDDYDHYYGRGGDRGYDRGEYDRDYDRYRYDEDRYDRRYPPRDYRGYDRYPSPPRGYGERRPAPPPSGFCEEPKLYVGGVPNELSNEDFREFLTQYGEVHDCIVMGGGFGFVTFTDSTGTYKALGAVMEIDGKKLTVQKAKPKKNGTRDEWTTFENKRRRE